MSLNKLRVNQPWDLQARNILNKLIAMVDGLVATAVTDGDKGDIVVSSSGAVWSFDMTALHPKIMSRVSLRF